MKKFLISSLAALLVMLALPVAGVFATSVTSQVQKNACIVQLSPVRAGQSSSSIVSTKCFASFSQSIAFATQGAIRLPAAATPKDITAAQMKSAAVRPFVLTFIGFLYANANEDSSGPVLTIEGSRGTCSTSPANSYLLTPMPSGWDDVVSSLSSSPDCNYTTLFTGTNQTGTATCYHLKADTLGAADNTASSVAWTKDPPTLTPAITCV